MSDRPVRLRVLMPNRVVVDKAYDFVRFGTLEGDIGVLAGHETYSAVLNDGVVYGHVGNAVEDRYTYLGGIVNVENDCVSILSPIADTPEKIFETIEQVNGERKDVEESEKLSKLEMHRVETALRRYLVHVDVSSYSIIRGNADKSDE